MKKCGTIFLLCLLVSGILTACDGKNPAPPEGTGDMQSQNTTEVAASGEQLNSEKQYVNTWFCGRATIDIVEDGKGYLATVNWGDSASSVFVYEYACKYDKSTKTLVCDGGGKKQNLIYDEDSNIAETKVFYEDGSATFSLTEEGKLLWSDAKDQVADGMEFEPVSYVSPDLLETEEVHSTEGINPGSDSFVTDYFYVIGGYPTDVAGSSLKCAEAANAVYAYAYRCNFQNVSDRESLEQDFTKAWKSLTPENRETFLTNYQEVSGLLDTAGKDWEQVEGQFQDAGVSKEFKQMLEDSECEASYQVLKDLTEQAMQAEE